MSDENETTPPPTTTGVTRFKVGDRLRNIHATYYPIATVTEITERGFKYEFDKPLVISPRLGSTTGGESFIDDQWQRVSVRAVAESSSTTAAMAGEVEAALAELRELFPTAACSVESIHRAGFGTPSPDENEPAEVYEARVCVWVDTMCRGKGATLSEAMQKVREWKTGEPKPVVCRKCGHHKNMRDPSGKCLFVIRDPGGSLVYCGCKCEFGEPKPDQKGDGNA